MDAAIVVEDLKRPVLLHVLCGNPFDFLMMRMLDLFDVEDSRNDMSPQTQCVKGGGSEKCFFLRQPKVCFGQLGQVIGCSTLGSTFE